MKKRIGSFSKLSLSMMNIMGKLLPSCDEVSRLTSKAMDEKLSLREKIGVRFHLMMCKWCRNFHKQMHLLREVIHKGSNNPPESKKSSLSPEAHQRMEEEIKNNH
jgi:predicted anti-sigma-YlaC factor YlaD